MYSLFYFLLGWFFAVMFKKVVSTQREKNKHLQKWKRVNDWLTRPGNSVGRNAGKLYGK